MELRQGNKRTEIDGIPQDWESKSLANCVDLLTGFPFPSSRYAESGVRLLRGSNVKRGSIDWADAITEYWPTIDEDVLRYTLRAGDLVIAMDGALVGRSFAQIRTSDLPALLLQRVARIRSSSIDIGYLTGFFASDYFSRHCDSVKTVTAIPHISPGDIRSFVIPLPPTMEEQRAIAAALSDVDDLLAKLGALIAKKRDIKLAAMQQLLTGKQRLPGYCGEWVVKHLGNIAQISMGRTPSRKVDAYWGRGYPWLSIADMRSKFVSVTKEEITGLAAAEMTVIPKGTLMMSFKLTIGKLAFAGCDIYSNEAICNFRDLKQDTDFLYYMLSQTDFSLYGKQAVKGYTLNTESLRAVEVGLPPFEEQRAIAAVLSDMDAEIAALEARLEKTRALKQGMMQELLTGRIRLL